MGGLVKEMGGLHIKLDGIWNGWLSWGDGGLVRKMGGLVRDMGGLVREVGGFLRNLDDLAK